jgi:hypothetical protein
MAAWEVELWTSDPTLSFTGITIGHNLSATLFGGTMPLIATHLYYKSVDMFGSEIDPFVSSLLPRLLPGFYISILGIISLLCISYIVKHPHDVRTGDPQLRAVIEREKRNFREAKAKKKKRKNMEAQLKGKIAPQTEIDFRRCLNTHQPLLHIQLALPPTSPQPQHKSHCILR